MAYPARRRRGVSYGHSTGTIKPDPEPQHDAVVSGAAGAGAGAAAVMVHAEPSIEIPADQGLYQNGRSDAPPPSDLHSQHHSERPTESEPLLREIRTRPVVVPVTAAAVSPRSVDESFFQTSFQDFGKKLKSCNDTLGELQQLGVSHDVQLPELVLVGDQSAGKSSLMSGLANLELPRSEGTCTRCPLHIRVSRNSDWSCRVWLRKEYTYLPPNRPIAEADVTEQDPFFPWRKMSNSKVHEFKTMHDKSDIEEVLRWAQIAILNDDKPHDLFVPGSGPIALNTPIAKASEETTAKFSPNVVALEMKGPGFPDLSFYDMPGIFQNPADANDEYLVNVVRNLSMAYIQHPSAIIICSMPMNSDAENSCTFGLIRRLGALSRTIGVLTKADLLPQGGNHTQWLDIMKGKAHNTGLGYFITSRRQDKDLDELTKWETILFEEHSYEGWPSTFHEFHKRCGVERLKTFLSERLGAEFAKSLPNIKQKVEKHLDRIVRQLAALPELPHNVELEIQTCLHSFADKSRIKIDEFAARINDLPASFRDCLLEIKPKFILKDSTDTVVLEVSDDESDVGSIAPGALATPTAKRRANMAQATPSKRPRLELAPDAPSPSMVKGEEGANNNQHSQPIAAPQEPRLSEPFTQFVNVGRRFRTLRQVHDEIQAKMKAGMPNIIPPEVYNDLAMEAITPWNGPTQVFLRQIIRLLHGELEAALSESLESLKKRVIYPEARHHLKTCLHEHQIVTQKALEELYEDETERLMTFNEDALKQCIMEEEDMLFRFRHQMRMQGGGFAVKPLPAWETLTEDKQAQDIKKRQNEEAHLKPDQFVREVKVVAYVRGYYRLAALRYADAVSQRIICRMIPAIRMQLRNYLDKKLGVQGPDAMNVYERLMDEDAATAQKRDMLKSERQKFELALESIETLEMGASAARDQDAGRSFSGGVGLLELPRRGSDVTMVNEDVNHGEA